MFLRNVGLHNVYTEHIPEDNVLHNHLCENLKSYTFIVYLPTLPASHAIGTGNIG
jgi:hypothetical protein